MLIDTSVWINCLQGKADTVACSEKLRQMPESQIATCGVIMAEVIPFLKDKNTKEITMRYFETFTYLEAGDDKTFWSRVISLREHLESKKIRKIGIPDIMILLLAERSASVLLTEDKVLQEAGRNLKIAVTNAKEFGEGLSAW